MLCHLASAVFQHVMQKVLAGLNPDGHPVFVFVYFNVILIFSETFEDHLAHLQTDSLIQALNLSCHFIEQKYLGHLITPKDISPNPAQTQAVNNFPVPTSVKDIRQLTSYYHCFAANFAKIAHPLHALTSTVKEQFSNAQISVRVLLLG